MRTSIRVTRTIVHERKPTESMAAVHQAMLTPVDSLEASVDLIDAAQESLEKSWKAMHALDELVKQDPGVEISEDI